jgi:1-acyl-sn-glycerol-3-phosphate acyltransferase
MSRTARTLGYLSNDEGIALLRDLAICLQEGEQVLLFPEGTRTDGDVLNPLIPGYALAAMRAKVPVQLVRIQAGTPILTKKQPFYRPCRFPATFHFDLGPCIEPGTFQTVKQFNRFVEEWFRANIPARGPLSRPFLPMKTAYTATTDSGMEVFFKVPDNPFYCNGHMPGNPIVPGYAQMAWVHETFDTHMGPDNLHGFFRWKFLKPLMPGDPIEIQIGPPAARRDIVILRNGERVTQGKVLVKQPD